MIRRLLPKKRWQRWLLEAAAILAVVMSIRAWQHQDILSGSAPMIQGMSLAGTPIQLQHFAGQPVLIHFFAPWCPICVANHGNIHTIAAHYPVLMIAVNSSEQELAQWLAEHPDDNPTQILNDPNGQWLAAFGAKALPTDIFIDRDGKIVTTELGYTSTIGLWLRLLFSQ